MLKSMCCATRKQIIDTMSPEDVDLQRISYGPPKQYRSVGFVPLKYEGLGALTVVGPCMPLVAYSDAISFSTDDSTPFQDFMRRMDDKVIDDALQRGSTWFGRKHADRDRLAALYKPTIKRDGTFRAAFESAALTSADTVLKSTGLQYSAAPVLRCGSVWIAEGHFGVTWRIVALRDVRRRQSVIEIDDLFDDGDD